MDPIIKQQWIHALRSGEYEQGTSTMKSLDNKYCCLGVLCDLYIKQHPGKGWLPDMLGYQLDNRSAIPPYSVNDWCKIEELNPTIPGYEDDEGFPMTLAGLNDSGYTFEQIADIIEKNF